MPCIKFLNKKKKFIVTIHNSKPNQAGANTEQRVMSLIIFSQRTECTLNLSPPPEVRNAAQNSNAVISHL